MKTPSTRSVGKASHEHFSYCFVVVVAVVISAVVSIIVAIASAVAAKSFLIDCL